MNLALFDLDNTLLDGDAETLWFEYLHQAGHLEGDFFGKLEEFTNDYDQEELDFSEYLNFILLPLKKWGPEKVKPWREQFLLEKIEPRLRYQNILHDHRRQGHVLVLITASHDFLAEPIGQMLEMDFTLSTRPEIIDGIYTGMVREACFREGKVEILNKFLDEQGLDPDKSWFYSDSQNDLPLMRNCDHPVAVHPDQNLRIEAEQAGWNILD